MADTYTAPARFFALPDGSVSSVQVKVVTDATGGITLVPVALDTPQQAEQWEQIQAAARPSPSQYDAKTAVAMARPLVAAESEHEAAGGNLLHDARFAAEAQAGVTVVTEDSAPANRAEYDERANAAAQLAAALGLALVKVADDPVMRVPSHLELRQNGMPYMAGDLATLETALRSMARERARNDAQIRLWQENRARIERERAEAIANLPENRLARLEAKLAAAGIEI